MNSKKEYDIIIIGAGLSGLTLAVELIKRTEKKVIILEKKKKFRYDKNWCFWNYPENKFSKNFNNSWSRVAIKFGAKKIVFKDPNIKYLRLKSSNFYNRMINELKQSSNCKLLLNQDVKDIKSRGSSNIVKSNKSIFKSPLVFDSRPIIDKKKSDIVQHFYGLEVEFNRNVFDDNQVTLMDFQKSKNCVHFFYILPFSASSALIETTYFSSKIFSKNKYKNDITKYIKKEFRDSKYKFKFSEKGIIPMFPSKRILNSNTYYRIGTSADWIKLSTGYGFQNSFKYAEKIVDKIIEKKEPIIKKKNILYLLDLIFLEFLKKYSNESIVFFRCFFLKNNYRTIVNFLIGKPSIFEIVKVLLSLPKIKLIKCLLNVIIKQKHYA